jgi:hypothetical protein
MITSKILGKTYKTKPAYKAQINKYEKHARHQLSLIQDGIKKGWGTWLGDPIAKHRRAWEVEVLKIEKEKKINL